ncbi:MAG: helix-turn-helix domain-containing protein [Pseudomonadota bacterium]|nr:helix-turn-helix domain-containing protein [Pseudomonadota bacterium]
MIGIAQNISTKALALLNLLPDAVLHLDPQNRIDFANASAEALFGISCDNLVGQDILTLLPDDVLACIIANSNKVETGIGKTPVAVRAVADGKDGTLLVVASLPCQAHGLSRTVERHLRQYFAAHEDGLPVCGLYGRVLREIERPLIAISLKATGGNQLRTADLLGLNRNTLRKKIRDLDIPLLRGSGKTAE